MTEIIDLTRKLDESLSIYSGGGYSDPPLLVESWCAIEEQGFKVSRLSMGTQTGTHIDAPAHFSPEIPPAPTVLGNGKAQTEQTPTASTIQGANTVQNGGFGQGSGGLGIEMVGTETAIDGRARTVTGMPGSNGSTDQNSGN